MAATLLHLAVYLLIVTVAAARKSERRQDYGDYGGIDSFLGSDAGAEGYAFADSFGGKKEKDPFAAVYGGSDSDEGDEGLFSAFAYDLGDDDDTYGEYDVDYEGSEKNEKKQKKDEMKKKKSEKAPETQGPR